LLQYVDHTILQSNSRNAEDHEFLRSAARRFGPWYSEPGNGVSHPTHMQVSRRLERVLDALRSSLGAPAP
jgi:aconitase A